MSDTVLKREAPKRLLCKWYPYTHCEETFDLDNYRAWEKHVVGHYINNKNFRYATGWKVPCWVKGCSVDIAVGADLTVHGPAFSQMMVHVYGHMKSSSVDWKDLRDDDGPLVSEFWESAILPAAHEGLIKWTKVEEWSVAFQKLMPTPKAVADTGSRPDMEVVDEKAERREMKRREKERAKGKGKASGKSGESSRGGGGSGSGRA